MDETPGFDPLPAARRLAALYRAGEQCTELPADIRPATMAQAYDVQDRLLHLLGEDGAGWKLGLGSVAQKRQAGIGRSIAGRVLRSQLYRPGATVVLPNRAPVTLEFEIAYVLGRDLRPVDPPTEPLAAVAEIRVAFELVLSRFHDRRAVGWPSFAADNAGFQALVLGDPVDPGSLPDLARQLAVSIDGREVARGVEGDDRTDPLGAFRDLVAMARERGFALPKGSVISTGTVSRPTVMEQPEATVAARYPGGELMFRTRAPAPA